MPSPEPEAWKRRVRTRTPVVPRFEARPSPASPSSMAGLSGRRLMRLHGPEWSASRTPAGGGCRGGRGHVAAAGRRELRDGLRGRQLNVTALAARALRCPLDQDARTASMRMPAERLANLALVSRVDEVGPPLLLRGLGIGDARFNGKALVRRGQADIEVEVRVVALAYLVLGGQNQYPCTPTKISVAPVIALMAWSDAFSPSFWASLASAIVVSPEFLSV